MTEKVTLAEALREEMLHQKIRRAWAGDHGLLLSAYIRTGRTIADFRGCMRSVLRAASRSALFVQRGYIRSSDSSGHRYIRYSVFVLAERRSSK